MIPASCQWSQLTCQWFMNICKLKRKEKPKYITGIWICFVFISRYEKDVSEKRCFNLAVNATSFSYLLCSGSVPPRWARPSRWSGGPTGTSSSTTPSHSSVGWSFYQDIWDFKFMTSQMQTGACAGKKPQPSPWFTIVHNGGFLIKIWIMREPGF